MSPARVLGTSVVALLLGGLCVHAPALSLHGPSASVASVHRDEGILMETDRLWRLNAPAGSETRLSVQVANVTPQGPVAAVAVRVLDAQGRLEAEATNSTRAREPAMIEAEADGEGTEIDTDAALASSHLPVERPEDITLELSVDRDLRPGVHWLVIGTEDAHARYHVQVASNHYGARVDRVGDGPRMYRYLHSDDPQDWQVTRRVATAGVLQFEARAEPVLRHGHNAVTVALDQDVARFALSIAPADAGTCTADWTDAPAALADDDGAGFVHTAWTPPSLHRLRADVSAVATDPSANPVVAAMVWDLGLPVPMGSKPACGPQASGPVSGPGGAIDEEPRAFGLDGDVASVLP